MRRINRILPTRKKKPLWTPTLVTSCIRALPTWGSSNAKRKSGELARNVVNRNGSASVRRNGWRHLRPMLRSDTLPTVSYQARSGTLPQTRTPPMLMAPQVPGPVLHRLSAQGQICAPDRTCDQEDHIQQRAVTTLRALARTCVLAVADHWGMSAAAGRIDRRRGREGAPAGGEAQEEAARTEGGRRFLQEEEADIVQHLRLV
mmetsp:Transcript_34878/g.74379  ORF Transcript_34878/g.74379 Transcript_34878/m.74379 type:complete len:203 (-) Transcript_34878:161-769(-)